MSDVNDCCACDSVRVNGGKEQRALPHTLSLGLFTPGHFMRFLWSDSYPIVKRPVLRIRNAFDQFKSNRSNHLCLLMSVHLLYMYSILGRGSFCFNYCLNSAWHGGDQFVALLRWYGSPGFFNSGLQVICIVGSGVSHLPLDNP